MIGIGWVNDEPVSEVETVAGTVVTDSSLVGKVVVPFAFTGGAEETTAVSLVGNKGGALADGAGEVEVSAVCVSEFCGSAGALELFFSVVAAVCFSFICSCNACTISLSDWTCSRRAWTSAVVAGVEAAGVAGERSAVCAKPLAVVQTVSAIRIRILICFPDWLGTLARGHS